ncbi:MAG: cellulose synthase family protein [bacterium]
MIDPCSVLGAVVSVALAALVPFGLHRLQLTARFLRSRGRLRPVATSLAAGPLPRVTVQLPIYDERYVVERAIRAAAALDYPRDRLEIQVLDDSTDETRAIVARLVAELRAAGHAIEHVERGSRAGYKAGALAHGMARAHGEIFAIFDADFVPPPDLLRRLLVPFADPRVGMVQARWSHANRDASLLTRLQATLLDGHFVIEHTARFAAGCFFNFNGTAGAWRRAAIEEAGGWQHDTLTEDLDLSYRAQLAGWRFVYLPFVTVPGELPVEMGAFRAQQRRWAMGSAQTVRKLAGRLWRAELPLLVKLEALAHLGGNLAYLLMAVASVLIAPALACRADAPAAVSAAWDVPLFTWGIGAMLVFYGTALVGLDRGGWRRLFEVPLAMGLGSALALSNAAAVLRGLAGERAAFERTPKYGASAGRWRQAAYRVRERVPWVELALAVSSAVSVALAVVTGTWLALPFVSMLCFGYGYTAWRLLWDGRREPEPVAQRASALEPI